MKQEYDVLRAMLKIDRDRLDDELIRQPGFYQRVAEEETYAVSERDKARDEMKRALAVLQLNYREEREAQKEKCTDSILLGLVENDDLYHEVQLKYREAAERAARWTALREAVQQRSYVLKDLCALWLGSYFSSSNVHGGKRDDGADVVHERVRERVAAARREGKSTARRAPPSE